MDGPLIHAKEGDAPPSVSARLAGAAIQLDSGLLSKEVCAVITRRSVPVSTGPEEVAGAVGATLRCP